MEGPLRAPWQGTAGGEGIRRLSQARAPSVPRRRRGQPAKDRRTFSIIYVTVGQSQFPTLRAGDCSQTPFQPEPPLWPAWKAATSSRSDSPGAGAFGSQSGSQKCSWPSPGGSEGACRREVALSASRGSPRRVWEPWILREGRRRGPQPAGALNNPSLSPGENMAHNLGVGVDKV